MELIETPFFTIIVPAYNCSPFIIDTIDSVKKQTFDNWELIIVDDNSSDGTYELVQQHIEKDVNIHLLKTAVNYGSPGSPRDHGVEIAKGQYIAFLDGDDTYHPQKLEKHYQSIKSNPDIEFIHTGYNIINEQGTFIKHRKRPWFLKLYERLFNLKTVCLLTNPFCISSTVIKKDFFQPYSFATVPKWISAVEDWFTWNRIMADRIPVIHFDKEPLTNYRWVTNSISDRDAHRCELQSIIFFSILLYNKKINFFEWHLATFIRLIRIFCAKFLGYNRNA